MSKDVALVKFDKLGGGNGFHITKTSLRIDDWVTVTAWLEVGESLGLVEGAVQWWIGDYLNHGERRYGEMYSQALDESQAKTWRNYKYVASRVGASTRGDISWSHHREVASLKPDEQVYWLDRADRESMSVRELHKAIRNQLESGSPAWLGMFKSLGVLARKIGTYGVPDDIQEICTSVIKGVEKWEIKTNDN